MGAQASKEELLRHQVLYGNVQGIQRLRSEGAGLEFIDGEGKTPLIVACMRPDLLPVAQVLIDLGANVNAYRPGCHAGTPLHHAAKRGLEQTVNLLLSRGANPSVANDDCLTPLEMARMKGHTNVVRAIENHICFFAGWLREVNLPGFLQAFAPQWASRKIWVVVIPCDHRNPLNPSKFELAVYPDLQTAQPKTNLQLWKAKLEAPDFKQTDPMLVVVDSKTRTRFSFLAEREGDKEQISRFYNACRGVYQGSFLHQPMPTLATNVTAISSTAAPPSNSEDVELSMAINASIQSAIAEGIPSQQLSTIAGTGWLAESSSQQQEANYNGWASPEPVTAPPVLIDTPAQSLPSTVASEHHEVNYHGWAAPEPVATPSALIVTPAQTLPTAPPIAQESRVQYPLIDSNPVDMKLSTGKKSDSKDKERKEESSDSGSCVICLDAPVEGACIPCGHMAGCMVCLNEVKGKNWGCPVCRAHIDQVVKLYAV